MKSWKRPWWREGFGAGGEEDDREWDGWMTSPTRWAWVCVNSGSWWWTGRPGVLWSMGLHRVRHDRDWIELNWTKSDKKKKLVMRTVSGKELLAQLVNSSESFVLGTCELLILLLMNPGLINKRCFDVRPFHKPWFLCCSAVFTMIVLNLLMAFNSKHLVTKP